jgi:hypothetical protein
MVQRRLYKLMIAQAILGFYGNRKFITVYTKFYDILSQLTAVDILRAYFSELHFNIILPSVQTSLKWPL